MALKFDSHCPECLSSTDSLVSLINTELRAPENCDSNKLLGAAGAAGLVFEQLCCRSSSPCDSAEKWQWKF